MYLVLHLLIHQCVGLGQQIWDWGQDNTATDHSQTQSSHRCPVSTLPWPHLPTPCPPSATQRRTYLLLHTSKCPLALVEHPRPSCQHLFFALSQHAVWHACNSTCWCNSHGTGARREQFCAKSYQRAPQINHAFSLASPTKESHAVCIIKISSQIF